MSGELDGKVAVVTGATGGMGRATVRALAAQGARVVVADLNPEAVASVASDVGGIGSVGDVSTEEGVAAYVAAALGEWGSIDILVNQAGIEHMGSIVDMSPADFDLHWAVNVRSAWLGMRAVFPHMYERGSGAVVNTSSVNGFIANLNIAGYVASKHAVIGLTKAASLEAGMHGVRVNAICPGPIDTPMLHRFATDEGIAAMEKGDIPLQRVGQPEEIADLVTYLVSPRSSYINGESIRIDGGLLSGRLF